MDGELLVPEDARNRLMAIGGTIAVSFAYDALGSTLALAAVVSTSRAHALS